MEIDVHWRELRDRDEAWHFTRVLYAYIRPDRRETLYIGKADGDYSTVWSRVHATDKKGFWNDLKVQRRIGSAFVLVGELALDEGARLTRPLLADVESLLIVAMQPWGNIQCRASRIARPGLIVRCLGRSWRGPRVVEDDED